MRERGGMESRTMTKKHKESGEVLPVITRKGKKVSTIVGWSEWVGSWLCGHTIYEAITKKDCSLDCN